jgi:leucyl aminopeptidase
MLKLTSRSLVRATTQVLAIPVCEDTRIHTDPIIDQCIAKALALVEFDGKNDQQVILYDPQGSKIHRCICIGIGPLKDINAERLRVFAAQAVKAAQKATSKQLVLAVPEADALDRSPERVMTALGEGACLANHAHDTYKEKPSSIPLKQIELYTTAAFARKYRSRIQDVETICRATHQARDWINLPSNDKPPETLAEFFSTAAKMAGVKVNVLHQAQLQRQKFGALLAVGKGSAQPPCMVEMVIAPKGAKKTIVLVGKGVTFDTGGISLKPSANMDAMKADMSGAACVAAAMTALAALKPKQRIIGLTPLVENMPSGHATRPGDIITSYAGKTVEIGNTDAEGRLILIDAMAYAIKKYKPDFMVDLATLTGACVVALGESIAGVFSNDNKLAMAISDSAQATHERCWRLPLPEDYQKLLKSDMADLNNMSSTRYGGAITAALFLSEFVGETAWAHIDIAGPAFSKKAGDYCGPGGAGFGVRLLCDLIDKL